MAQSNLPEVNTKADTNTIPFYKWEVGIDLLPLIGKSRDVFGYIVKRNFQTQDQNHRQALRVKFLPSLAWSNLGGASASNNYYYAALGYEWQNMMNRFSILYGGEAFILHERLKNGSPSSPGYYSNVEINTGLRGFIGCRYFLSSRFSLSLESHLVYNYRVAKVDGILADLESRDHTITINPINAIYLNYHF